MRAPVVAGNWKMNGDTASVDSLVGAILVESASLALQRCSLLVFPSYVHLAQVAAKLKGSAISVGAQDVDQRRAGAVTGGVSVQMVKDLGATHALVGHSERRTLFAEDDDMVARKFEECITGGVVPIVCVGETLAERKQNKTLEVVTRQLRAITDRVNSKRFGGAMIAYEPVWAIGTGESATPEQAEAVHFGLRQYLKNIDAQLSESIRILYGGSVTPENAKALFTQKNVDGALVGGASLKAKSFAEICKAGEES